jgi:hypothetical protein
MEQHEEEDTFVMDIVISGELTLKRVTGQAHGEGSDDIYLTLGGSNEAFICQLTPTIQGSGAFQSDATFSPVTPGVENMSFDLIFDRVPYNSSVLYCANLIGGTNIQANFPFPAGQWDPDEMGLQGLSVILNNGSGSVPVSFKGMRGQVTIRREVQP